MGEFVHDPRHRYSYELRPDPALDTALRAVAAELEAAGLLTAGAATAARFHPHLTFARADHASPEIVEELARRMAPYADCTFAEAGSFGGGRIAWVAPDGYAALDETRTWLLETLGSAHVDPQVLVRSPWTPHVTLGYAVGLQHRDAVQAHLRAAVPLTGRWQLAQAWDLDVRPTVLVHAAAIP